MGKLFGTDGARGIANETLDCELAMKIGRAAAVVLAKGGRRPLVLIGKDPRRSSDMLEAVLTAGLCSVGADAVQLGVVPTPAVAWLTQVRGADAGVMISASHNPAQYNGIKLFSREGRKLPDAVEDEIEALVFSGKFPLAEPDGIGREVRQPDAAEDYLTHLCATVDADLLGMKIPGAPRPLRIAVDCGNGSAAMTAPRLFSRLGLDAVFLNASPDGLNINRQCGSTDLRELSAYVKAHGCDIGFAFDGDADRCLAVDECGATLDGDRLIALLASDMKARGELRGGAVVTVMSNLGFFRYCRERGIETATTKVGDRYVLEEMLRSGKNIGGEQSGHIILSDWMPTGDGQLTAIHFLEAYRRAVLRGERSLHALAETVALYPQVLRNVEADGRRKAAFRGAGIAEEIREIEKGLGGEGRILVRPSGTEAYIRVMAEGPDRELVEAAVERTAALIAAL